MIKPALWFQNRLAVVSVEIQQGFQVGFVMVGIRLGADEGPVESHADLLEEGMSDVVDDIGAFSCHRVTSCGFLQCPFQFEVAA